MYGVTACRLCERSRAVCALQAHCGAEAAYLPPSRGRCDLLWRGTGARSRKWDSFRASRSLGRSLPVERGGGPGRCFMALSGARSNRPGTLPNGDVSQKCVQL